MNKLINKMLLLCFIYLFSVLNVLQILFINLGLKD